MLEKPRLSLNSRVHCACVQVTHARNHVHSPAVGELDEQNRWCRALWVEAQVNAVVRLTLSKYGPINSPRDDNGYPIDRYYRYIHHPSECFDQSGRLGLPVSSFGGDEPTSYPHRLPKWTVSHIPISLVAQCR